MATSTGVRRERAPMLEGDTPLIDATRHGRLADVASLLSGGADVNEPKTDDSGATALCIAAQEGHMEVVSALLAAGALLDVADDPALQYAASCGHVEVVAALLAAGARVDDKDEHGATALHLAANEGHAVVVSALLASGATVDSLWIHPEDPSQTTTSLFMASQEGHVEVVATLLEAGACVDGVEACDATPLYVASQEGHVEVVVVLLAAGAHADLAQLNEATPLFVASQEGHVEILAALLAAGARVEGAKRSDGSTPLWAASANGHTGAVSALLAAGAEVDPICQDDPEDDATAATPLWVASSGGHADMVSALLNACASIDWSARDDRWTPLMAASQPGHVEVLTVLLEAGAAVNQTDHGGRTAMVFACAVGHLTCIKLLSLYGATRTFHAAPDDHYTAEQVAEGHDHEALAAWLVESRLWSTPLHHLCIIGSARARELLRGGADLHAAAAAGGPTPLSLAQALRAAGDAAEGSAASLVLAAAGPWGPRTHSLFPATARTFAAELLLIGHQLSRQPRFAGEEISLVDVWTQLVMPFAVVR